MSDQTKEQKIALNAAWLAHPTVAAFQAAVAAHVADNGLTGLAGMNATLAFSNAWVRDNGPLPESGILCD